MKILGTGTTPAALLGVLFLLPLFGLNIIVANRIEPLRKSIAEQTRAATCRGEPLTRVFG